MESSRYKHSRRNFLLFMADYMFFGTAFSMMDASTVIPGFVSQLTTDERIIGLSGSVFNFAWLLPQMLLAQFINRSTRRKPFLYPSIPLRFVILFAAFVVGTSGATNAGLTLFIFLTAYAIFAAGDGFISIAWADMLGSSLPDKLRGTLFSAGQLIMALGGLSVSFIVRLLLDNKDLVFPMNYALLFGFAGVFFVIGGICLSSTIEEEPEEALKPGPAMNEYLPFLGNVLRTDREFQRFALLRFFYDLSTMAIPFYIVFGAETLRLNSDTLVADALQLTVVGRLGASFVYGFLSRRYGSRAVLRAGGICKALQPALAIVSLFSGQPVFLYLSFFLMGFMGSMGGPGYFDWIITHAPPAHRPIYIGLTNTLSALSNLAPLVGGFVVSLTSYPFLFGLALIMAIIGVGISIILAEPRHKVKPAAIEPVTATL